MPTYDFKCPECGYELNEYLYTFHDADPCCPKCIEERKQFVTMKKMLSALSFVFKGNGFHSTDYKDKK
jgi:putative FmdB family regulatory protein